jgi:hypothetical protein
MPAHAADLMSAGKDVAGLFVVPRGLPLRQAIEDLELLITCSENAEWVNVIRYLPLCASLQTLSVCILSVLTVKARRSADAAPTAALAVKAVWGPYQSSSLPMR